MEYFSNSDKNKAGPREFGFVQHDSIKPISTAGESLRDLKSKGKKGVLALENALDEARIEQSTYLYRAIPLFCWYLMSCGLVHQKAMIFFYHILQITLAYHIR